VPDTPAVPRPAPPPVVDNAEIRRLRALSQELEEALRESAIKEEEAKQRVRRAEQQAKSRGSGIRLPLPTAGDAGAGTGAGTGAGAGTGSGVGDDSTQDKARVTATEFMKKVKIGVPVASLLQKYGLPSLPEAEGQRRPLPPAPSPLCIVCLRPCPHPLSSPSPEHTHTGSPVARTLTLT
jgi:hypothetical protein